MANGRNKNSKGDSGRDSGGFVALPWTVLDSAAYARLSHPAKALLLELARQFVRDNNGRLLASSAYLGPRGWKSRDVITRAKIELIEAGFIFETVKGHRPNRASWYAVTWRTLDKIPGFDEGAAACFERGAYQTGIRLKKVLVPPHGLERASIAPPHGLERLPPRPAHGTVRAVLPPPPRPSHGNHLEKPSTATSKGRLGATAWAIATTTQTPSIDLDDDGGQIERVRDRDQDPARFDPTTGEYFTPPTAPARQQKGAADRWVKSALAATGR